MAPVVANEIAENGNTKVEWKLSSDILFTCWLGVTVNIDGADIPVGLQNVVVQTYPWRWTIW